MSEALARAAEAVLAGGVIAYPTETVYGLGCLPDNEAALRRLIAIKGRDADKGFILLAATIEQLMPYTAELDSEAWQRIATPQARATTWTVPAPTGISPLLTGGRSRIAVRITHHAPTRDLCRTIGSALVSTSANFSGEAPVKRADALPLELVEQLDYLLEGPCGDDPRPSRIVDLETGRILRQ